MKEPTMQLNLSRLHFPVTTLGPGRRVGIWFQGCSLHCPGCVSVDTWAAGHGRTTLKAVLEALEQWLPEADGITISGGEPFEQPEALEGLLRRLRPVVKPDCDFLVYSGYPWEKLESQVLGWPGLIDGLISDPFAAEAAQTLALRGSDNQRMHLLTPLGHSRLGEWRQAPRSALPQALDVFFQDGEVWMAGIPEAGSMEAIKARLAEAGFTATTSTGGPTGLPVFA